MWNLSPSLRKSHPSLPSSAPSAGHTGFTHFAVFEQAGLHHGFICLIACCLVSGVLLVTAQDGLVLYDSPTSVSQVLEMHVPLCRRHRFLTHPFALRVQTSHQRELFWKPTSLPLTTLWVDSSLWSYFQVISLSLSLNCPRSLSSYPHLLIVASICLCSPKIQVPGRRLVTEQALELKTKRMAWDSDS